MAKLKVYGGYSFLPRISGQQRIIVAASNITAAARAVGCSPYEIRTYWSETGNVQELATALAQPGIVFYRGKDDRGAFKQYDKPAALKAESEAAQ